MGVDFAASESDLVEVLRTVRHSDFQVFIRILNRSIKPTLSESTNDRYVVINELQRLGGNSLANMLRGHGVRYDAIARDLARKLHITDAHVDTAAVEWSLIEHLILRAGDLVRQDLMTRFESLISRTMDDRASDGIWHALRHPEQNLHARMTASQFVLRYVLEGADLLEPRTIAYIQDKLEAGRIVLWDVDGQQVSEAIDAIVARVVRDAIRSLGGVYRSLLPIACLIGYLRARRAYENAAQRSVEIPPWISATDVGAASSATAAAAVVDFTVQGGATVHTEAQHGGFDQEAVARVQGSATTPAIKPQQADASCCPACQRALFDDGRCERCGFAVNPCEAELGEAFQIARHFLGGNLALHPVSSRLFETVPKEPGVYAWYFDDAILPALPKRPWAGPGPWRLLYIGITGEGGGRTLRQRIWNCHVRGTIHSSTLRHSVGALITDQVGAVHSGQAAGEPERVWEDRLTTWLYRHARVTWYVTQEPAAIEKAALMAFGHALPLNIRDNPANDFAEQLRILRRQLKL